MFKLEEIRLIRKYANENRADMLDALNDVEYKDDLDDTSAIVNEIRICNSIINKCDEFIKD
jgi:hypothetical protein